MTGGGFELRREDIGGNPAIILSGEIDISNAAHLARALKGSVSNQDHDLVLDLSQVTYVDSAGIKVLFELASRLKDHQQRLILAIPEGSRVRRSLMLGGLLQTVEVVPETPLQGEGEIDGPERPTAAPKGGRRI